VLVVFVCVDFAACFVVWATSWLASFTSEAASFAVLLRLLAVLFTVEAAC
jgi:hypothetical protein